MNEYKKPILYLSYTDVWGNKTKANMEIVFNDYQAECETLFAAFARFLIMTGYSPDSVKQYFEDI